MWYTFKKLASIRSFENIRIVKSLSHSNKIFTESLGKEKEHRVIGKDVSQVDVLSPLLYLIYVLDIAKGISKSVLIYQFADDIEKHCSILPIKKCKKDLEYAANSIIIELSELGLELAPQKTVFY